MVYSRDIYVLVCVEMGLLWYCVVMTCCFLTAVVCVLCFVYLQFWYVSPLEQVLAGTHSRTMNIKWYNDFEQKIL
jgi:cell division septal protein FtsQ